MRALGVGIVALLTLVTFESKAQPVLDWEQADLATVRLDVSDIENLADPVRAELFRRNCAVPQAYGARSTVNVIFGRFHSSDEVEVAVLCSRDRISSILVFRGGTGDLVDELALSPDRDYLQVVLPGEIGFSRQITLIGPETIGRSAEALDEDVPGTLDHDGIDDAFVRKASTIWYWSEGHWRQLRRDD